MENLKYIVEDSILAELLGVQNFSNKESAILELVKNAFDANALSVKIYIRKDSIELVDNGCGMNKKDVIDNWMHIGKSNKGYDINDQNGNKRIQAGSKGVGRFALARLGAKVQIDSKKEKCKVIRWSTDWNYSTLEEIESNIAVGTAMYITKLRDKWTEKTVYNLADYLGRTYCDDAMKIDMFFEDKPIPVNRLFDNPQVGRNYSSKISLKYNAGSKKLNCTVESDEFREEAQEYSSNNISFYSKEIDVEAEFIDRHFNDEIVDISRTLSELGDFSADLYFGLERVLRGDEERFLYKRKFLDEMYDCGIILFRNSFSISSYEGKKDWLGLGKRSRKSPAAATHPTGSWRVRENQISGNVNIDKKRNKNLQDLSNRQGLDENNYYKLFVEIILIGVAEFERYRQSIIREINKKNKLEKKKELLITDKVVKNPNTIKNLTKDEEGKLVTEIKEYKKEKKEYKKSIENTEKRYKYDVRILNVLATLGLKATSIAHEMKNDRNKIDGNYNFIVKALEKYDLWDMLNEPEYTKASHLNIPELLEKNRDAGEKLLQFMDVMLEEVEKRQFIPEEYSIKELLEKVKNNWHNDYAWCKIDIDISEEVRFTIPEDVVNVIFDNLILNSLQQNEKRNRIDICIKVNMINGLLNVEYKDNGVGLSDKYRDSPMKILEPHETSRKKGHGLGMWIVNNTLNMSGGEVLDITGENGFRINFVIGGKL